MVSLARVFGAFQEGSFYIASFLLVLSVVVFVHEYGHYSVAKLCGVKVKTFSLGFGPELFGITDGSGTRWKFSLVPVGGYVKMLGDTQEDNLSEGEKSFAFNEKPLWQRFAVAGAGPLANLLFAVLVFFVLFATRGVMSPMPIVGAVLPGSTAEKVGLMVGDRIVEVDGHEVSWFEEIRHYIAGSPNQEFTVVFLRDGVQHSIKLSSDVWSDDARRLGIAANISPETTRARRLPVVRAAVESFRCIFRIVKITLVAVVQLVTGARGIDELGGPVRIAKHSGSFPQENHKSQVSECHDGYRLRAPAGPIVPTSAAAGVTRVKVVGNERLDSGTVQFYAKVPLTGDVTQPEIDEAIKNLYATSLFSRVSVRVEGNELVIRVKENPVVRSIKIVGNRVFSDKNLENDVLKMKKMSIFTEAKLKRDLSTLHALYQSRGMLGAKVSYAVRRAPHNAVDIVLNIVEGKATRIGEIRFVGNKAFSSSELRAIIYSKEHKLKEGFGLFGGSTKFFAERLVADQSILQEGKKYQFGESTVTVSDIAYSYEGIEKDLLELVLSKKGGVFDATMVNGSVARITAHLNERGNLFASVKSDYDVQGDVTLDNVIRRKLGIHEGDVYSTGAVRQSRKRLADMDFFETVDVETQKISDSLVDLNFRVKERGTGSFDIGAGFSSESGLVGKISVRERNAFGAGKMVAFDLSRSMTSLSGTLDLVTPNVLDSDVAFGVGVFYSQQGSPSSSGGTLGGLLSSSEGSFSSTNAGLSTRLSCNLTDSVAASLQYYYKYHSIHNIGESASIYIKEQEGRHFDSAVGYSLVYSSLDSTYKPSTGVFAKVSQLFSGIGGNLHYVKTEASSAHFFPVFRRIHNDIVLKVRPSFGYVFAYSGETVKIGQRFFVGNSEIRGFAASGIGPRDRNTKESLGGKLFYGLTTQLDFPIGLPEHLGIRGSVFADVASLSRLDSGVGGYDTSDLPRLSIGFGFSWKSPFGPVRIDFGFPIVKEKFDIKDRIRISTDAGAEDASVSRPVLFIDSEKVLGEALVAKDIRAQLDRRRTELQSTFSRRGEELRKGEDELIKQKSILSSEAFEVKVAEFRKEVDSLNRDAAAKMSELEGMYSGAMEQVYNKVQQISKRLAGELGATIVFFIPRGQVAYVEDSADISERVLEALNKDLSRVSMGGS
ncbi:hypothetical protein GH714_042914 [Hevea brasiliensis]|uniref:PDZ domain-containing protein n=1 Tax=Hevea brasiliensis TaxID=3981 RepID=A0A6A6JZT8_HEVBR|nr:hypothetical protein GH714_042914 [Hevea brasiliensis]